MAPSFYDPNSPDEQPVPMPSASSETLKENIVLHRPLTRRGTGPGLIVVLPAPNTLKPRSPDAAVPLDPEPIQKWAEEGFVVVGIAYSDDKASFEVGVKDGADALLKVQELDNKERFGVIVYEPRALEVIFSHLATEPRLGCVTAYGSPTLSVTGTVVPTLCHLTSDKTIPHSSTNSELPTIHSYAKSSPFFVLPHSGDYDPGCASLAHSRTLVFLKKHLGGPKFDLEAIWDEHCYFEFEVRSVTKTMATMVAEPYVNHVPTMTGGVGRKALTTFYRDHFIFANPPDTTLQLVSRTVGVDRVVDEFIFGLTHDRTVDWLLPGVPATGKKLAIPMMGVINIRGDRLYHEHIWWDQATVLKQAGLIPSHVPFPLDTGTALLRLPVAGVESTRLLADETDGKSNEMFGEDWGISQSK